MDFSGGEPILIVEVPGAGPILIGEVPCAGPILIGEVPGGGQISIVCTTHTSLGFPLHHTHVLRISFAPRTLL